MILHMKLHAMYAVARSSTGGGRRPGRRAWATPSLLPTQPMQLPHFRLVCAENLTQIRNFGTGFSYSVGNPSNQYYSSINVPDLYFGGARIGSSSGQQPPVVSLSSSKKAAWITNVSFQVPSNSLFISHPTIRPNLLWKLVSTTMITGHCDVSSLQL